MQDAWTLPASAPPPRNLIDIWLCYESDVDAALLGAYAPLLTAAERAKAARFHFAADRNRHITSRALLRTVLPNYLGIDRHEVQFVQDQFGRPGLEHPRALACKLDFNLSHTAGLIALAVTCEVAVGVDVENVSCHQPAMELASRFFSPEEVASLRRVEAEALNREFYRHWTLKESYLKAYGVGLSLPLDRFGFHLRSQWAEFFLAAAAPHTADDWFFAQWLASPQHLLAVCASRSAIAPTFHLRRIVPLVSSESIQLPELCRTPQAL
jgi:4'-phosphopantetheinyl transferase